MSHHLTKTGSGQTWRESGTHKEMGFLTETAGRSRPSAFSRAVLPLRGRLVPLRGRLVLRETAPFNCVIGVRCDAHVCVCEQTCTVDDFSFGVDGDDLPEPDWSAVKIGKDGLVEL